MSRFALAAGGKTNVRGGGADAAQCPWLGSGGARGRMPGTPPSIRTMWPLPHTGQSRSELHGYIPLRERIKNLRDRATRGTLTNLRAEQLCHHYGRIGDH